MRGGWSCPRALLRLTGRSRRYPRGAGFGWKGDFRGFFLGLKANNSKTCFPAHRCHYEEDVKGPLLALLADLEPEFGAARLSRPNIDIRFAADKSPYKTPLPVSLHDRPRGVLPLPVATSRGAARLVRGMPLRPQAVGGAQAMADQSPGVHLHVEPGCPRRPDEECSLRRL